MNKLEKLSELKPCPFCGSDDLDSYTLNRHGECAQFYDNDEIDAEEGDSVVILCQGEDKISGKRCGASSPQFSLTQEEAIEKWNRRV